MVFSLIRWGSGRIGGGVKADAQTVTIATDDPSITSATANGVLIGAVNETAPASDTASSGLNGRLQRIAQNLTTIDGRVDTLETLIASTNTKLDALARLGLSATASFTPAANSHVANDVVGGAQAFALGAVSGSHVMITDVELEIDSATAEATAWRLYLYSVTPPSAIGDDFAWDLGAGDRASYLGYVELGTAIDLGSTQWVETHGVNKVVKLSGTGLFGYLVNLTTLTPAAVAHIVNVRAEQR